MANWDTALRWLVNKNTERAAEKLPTKRDWLKAQLLGNRTAFARLRVREENEK
jgi:hypothetical protein